MLELPLLVAGDTFVGVGDDGWSSIVDYRPEGADMCEQTEPSLGVSRIRLQGAEEASGIGGVICSPQEEARDRCAGVSRPHIVGDLDAYL